MTETDLQSEERLRRWRLILGGGNADGIRMMLSQSDREMDGALEEIYGQSDGIDDETGKRGGTQASMPNVSRWLGDIRKYFPASVVQVMQKDAIERVGLRKLLGEPEFLELVQPDVHLVATLIALKDVIPNDTKATARIVVKKVVDDLLKRLEQKTRQAILGALNRALRHKRPKYNEIDWNRTILTNLKHYQPEYQTIIPETRIGFTRKRSSLRDVILCIDQSGSMASSVVYSSIFGAVMASIPAVRTHLVVFDTSVVDLTHELHDPVEILFGTQLGGGTYIDQALEYCRTLITRPRDTILVLITDLYEGGNQDRMLKLTGQIKESGVQMVTLLALSDDGKPSYDHQIAASMAGLGVPTFACTPDLFPDLMATALNRGNIEAWAARNNIPLPRQDNDPEAESL
ncbi:MAG: VWA domain-containing protein [Anaerolineae bacterium]|nr:VWA domain-containing protein [Anaerolineae bacterium]